MPASDVYVHGRNFDGDITAALEDPNDPGASLPTPIVTDVEPSIVRLSVPDFTTSRRRFQIRLFKNGTQVPSMRPESSDVYLRSGGGTPPAQSIRLQYISMLEIWSHNSTRVSDRWSSSGWADWKVHVDQASRDWASICGATWNPGSGQIVSGFAEEVPRASLIWNPYFRLDVCGDQQ